MPKGTVQRWDLERKSRALDSFPISRGGENNHIGTTGRKKNHAFYNLVGADGECVRTLLRRIEEMQEHAGKT